jgi:hypothetical protein
MHEAAELDEWVPQRARVEDELRELKRPIGRAGGLCSKGTSRSMRSSTAELVRPPEALIASRMKVKPSPGEHSAKPRQRPGKATAKRHPPKIRFFPTAHGWL